MTDKPNTIPPDHNIHLHRNDVLAILLVLLSYLVFSVADSCIKYISPHFDTYVILFWDAFFCLIFMAAYVLFKGGRKSIQTTKIKYHVFKGVLGILIGMIVIYSLGHTTLAEYYLMVFTTPIWVVLFARLMMDEKLTPMRSSVVLAGFGVILYMFLPEGELTIHTGMLAALMVAFLVAFSMIFVRKYLKGEPAALLGGFSSVVIVLLLAVFAIPKTPPDILWALPYLAVVGLCIFSANIFLAKAFHTASLSAVLAPFHYSQMIYGVLIGYFLFSEVPSSRTLIGSLALVVIGLTLFWYDFNNNKTLKRYA